MADRASRKTSRRSCKTARDNGSCLRVLESVEHVNDEQKHRLFQKLQQAIGPELRGTKVAVWGLAFKPNTDDMREAPAITLIEDLLNAGRAVAAHDPVAMPEAQRRLGERVTFVESNYDALSGADALAIVTDWNEYRHPDFQRIKTSLRRPVIVDGRNLYSTSKMAELGFKYHSMGRGGAE